MLQDAQVDRESYGAEFGRRLRHLRLGRGLSQMELADRVGMHLNGIGFLERNRTSRPDSNSNPHMDTLLKLARALEVPVTALLPASDDVPPSRLTDLDSRWPTIRIELDAVLARHPRGSG